MKKFIKKANNSLNYYKENKPTKVIFKNSLSPGDIIVLTALIRDIHQIYPNMFKTDVRTTCKEIWENNPYLTPLNEDDDVIICDIKYPLIHNSNQRAYHFIHGYIDHFNKKTGLNVYPTEFKGDIHISDKEKGWISQVEEITGGKEPFWIVVSGGKYDYTAKWWNPHRMQEVVNYFKDEITFVQVGEKNHNHPELKNVINLVGKTDLRQMIRLMYHSAGVICPVTMHMHLAAATECYWRPKRPCIVIAGGREGTQWEMYPNHQYLHTVGMLPCCTGGGCWKSRVIPLSDGDKKKNESLCLHPTLSEGDIYIPKCLDMITEFDVIKAVERYLEYDKIKEE